MYYVEPESVRKEREHKAHTRTPKYRGALSAASARRPQRGRPQAYLMYVGGSPNKHNAAIAVLSAPFKKRLRGLEPYRSPGS